MRSAAERVTHRRRGVAARLRVVADGAPSARGVKIAHGAIARKDVKRRPGAAAEDVERRQPGGGAARGLGARRGMHAARERRKEAQRVRERGGQRIAVYGRQEKSLKLPGITSDSQAQTVGRAVLDARAYPRTKTTAGHLPASTADEPGSGYLKLKT